jgi:hypothetical protein
VSSPSARHRKPSRISPTPPAGHARHRKRSGISALLSRGPALVAAGVGITLIAGAGAAFAVTAWPASGRQPPHNPPQAVKNEAAGLPAAGLGTGRDGDQPMAASARPTASSGPAGTARTPASKPADGKTPAPVKTVAAAPPPVYRNPLRKISGLLVERIDMGADFGGTGPIYALGNAVITNATADNSGWPGGGWITYQLTSGPASGLQVYVGEDVKPTVQVGQKVTSSTVIANMFNGGSGIETGWAMPDGLSAESQLPVAGSVSGGGPFPTDVGLNFDSLLQALGVPAAFNFAKSGFGTLPSNYPTSWASLTTKS